MNVAAIKAAARGRWPVIIPALTGVSAELFDGRHRPCPRCGGKDRFRAFDDFAEMGGAFCNQCHQEKNGDGIATLGWLTGDPFPTVVNRLADHLGVQHAGPQANGKPASNGKAKAGKLKTEQLKRMADPGMAGALIRQWCNAKAPITEAAVVAAGGSVHSWPKGAPSLHRVIAFPAFGDGESPAGMILFRADGKPFPAIPEGLGERKSHNLAGSADGWVMPGGRERIEAAETIWKVEGVPDSLAMFPHLPDVHAVVTNICGAKASGGWGKLPLGTFAGKKVIVVPDADDPGQRGAEKFAEAVASSATDVRIVRLPYEVSPDHGKDLRDFLTAGEGTFQQLQQLAEEAVPFTPVNPKGDSPAIEPGKVIRNARIEGEGEDKQIVPLPMADILEDIESATGGWPRLANGGLFVDSAGVIQWIPKSSALFGWLGTITGSPAEFRKGAAVHTQSEVYEELRRTAQQYEAIEKLPHEPEIPGVYYVVQPPEPGDGEALQALVERFNPETLTDADLIRALFVTAIWGGRPGARPAFVITSTDGRGAGKSTLIHMVAYFAGGLIEVSPQEDAGKLKTRLLSPDALTKRVIILDNVKSLRFSWGELEGLVTATTISGHRMYVGETQRPNTLLWCLTLNGVSLATDLAQRAVVIKVRRPTYSGDWAESCRQFIDDNRQALIADCIGFLRSDRFPLEQHSRWGAWEREILERLPEPAEAQRLILDRQAESNAEADEAQDIEDHFAQELRKAGYRAEDAKVFIPSAIARQWLVDVTADKSMSQTKATRFLNQQIEEAGITRLASNRCKTHGRGFVWHGEEVDPSEPVNTDLEGKLERMQRRGDLF